MLKSKLIKAARFLLITAIVILCACLIWALVLHVLGLDIQWWGKAMILTCLASALVAAFLLRKLWQKRKEKKFVDGIIGSEQMPGNISALDDASRELRRRFREAVSTLKRSHLKGRGNPLYVLPWYLIIGRSGSGKSTAIRSARLPSPFGDINRISGIEGTRNCDWWFFDDSVLIDTAGRYAMHRNRDLDRGEWLAFLEHLVKYRKREPINGIIVTVEADQLLEADPEQMFDEGRTLRRRIDEVINVMGARFPIYLLVTKSDLIYGMNRYHELLPEPSLEQAMGLMNHDGESDITVFVNRTIDTMVEKLKDIRLILANRDEVKGGHYLEPEVLLFPDEFARIRNGLIGFCKGAFKDNPFQELPGIRGIYFCSGRQEGRPVLSRAERLGTIENRELPGTGNGFFLHDFFAKIVPADRPLHTLTRSAREWYRLTQNLWLTGFVTLVLIACILLTHSWNENKATMNLVSPEYKKSILFKNDPITDIGIMEKFGRQIEQIEEKNRSWHLPRLGLTESLGLEKRLKKRYCDRFYEHFDADINIRIEGDVANGGWQRNGSKPAVRYLPFIIRRINLIKARFDGADLERLRTRPDPGYARMALSRDPSMAGLPEVADEYRDAYLHYVAWQTDVEVLNKTLAGLQRLLGSYFLDGQGDLKWLAEWADRELKGETITLNTFWKSNGDDSSLVRVAPAFTLKGKRLIGNFIVNELNAAVEQPLWVVKPKEQFAAWYKDAYYAAWMDFGRHFDQGRRLYETDEAWGRAVARLCGDDSPYWALLDRMGKELLPVTGSRWPSLALASDDPRQPWLMHIRDFDVLRRAAASDAIAGNREAEGFFSRLSMKGRLLARIAGGAMNDSQLGKGKKALSQYMGTLAGFDGVCTSGSGAYEIAKAGFQDDPVEPKSPVSASYKAIAHLKTVLDKDAPLPSDESNEADPFWCLLAQPVDALWAYTVSQAGRHLQKLWDQNVIVKTEGIYEPNRLDQLLFGDNGQVSQFVKAYADPFMGRNTRRGFFARECRGCSIPFDERFFRYIRHGQSWGAISGNHRADAYRVDIVGLPTDVNSQANIKPDMTRLTLEGAAGSTVLENRQYPLEKTFTWTPDQSGDVTLEIFLGDVVLTKKYTGNYAFGKFLRTFHRGKRDFTVKDFPENRADFNRFGVTRIEVIYQLQDRQIRPIIQLMDTAPGKPPARIIS
jgi:type VI secretion system protein ImpL